MNTYVIVYGSMEFHMTPLPYSDWQEYVGRVTYCNLCQACSGMEKDIKHK